MTSNPTTHMNRQYGPLDTLIHAEELSATKFAYDGYRVERPKHKEFKKYSPVVKEVTLGGITRIEFPIHPDKLGPIQFHYKLSSLTNTGGDATYMRYTDYVGLAAIERLVWKFSSNTVYTLYPAKKFWRVMKHCNVERKTLEAQQLAGDLDDTTRSTLATGTQNITFDVPFPWTLSPDRYQEIRQLAQSPVLEIHWHKASEFVNTDGSNVTFTVSDPYVSAYTVFLEPHERDMNTMVVESDHGIVRLTEETFFEVAPTSTLKIPAGTSGVYRIDLKNLKTSVRLFMFWLRFATNYTAYNVKPYDITTFYKGLKRFRLVTGGDEIIFDWVDTEYNLGQMHKMYYHSLPGAPLYFYSFDDNPMDELNAHGSYNFQAVLNPILELDFGNATGNIADNLEVPTVADMYLTFGESKWNMIQTVRGEIASQFS
jgi:hypothetical protein